MAKETDICRQQLDAANQLAGKKPEVADKIVRGKVLKRLSELCLLSQPHVAEEGAPVVSKVLAALALESAGSGATCAGFERWTVGAQ
jgi:translation elongation factor EF-Ts